MNAIDGGLQDAALLVDTMPIGVAIYSAQHRLLLANAAMCATVGLPPGALRPGTSFADNARMAAYLGVYGPGDPDRQAEEISAGDLTQRRLMRRRGADGRSFDAHYVPMPDGGLLICVVDTSSVLAMRDEAERLVGRIQLAVANLRIGLAVFGPDRRMDLHNQGFAKLLGLPPSAIRPDMTFDDVLAALKLRDDYAGTEGDLFLAAQRTLDRAHPSGFRRMRANGLVIDVQSDPLPDGGWSITVADVSPLVRAEDEARRRAAVLDNILRQVPHGIVVYGPDRQVTMVNDAYNAVMAGATVAVGDAHEAVLRRRAAAGEYGDEPVAQRLRAHMATDMTVPHMRRRRRPDGRTIEVRSAPLPDGGYVIVVSDISQLIEAQAELERKAELMASIVSHIPHGVSVYGPDRALRLVNTAYNTIMSGAPIVVGDTVDQVIAKRAQANEYGPGDPDDVVRVQRSFDNSRPQMRRRQRPNGTTIDIRTAPLPDGGHISVVTDVSPLVAAEAELARRAATMDAMLANIRHGIVLWDHEDRIVAANAVVSDLLSAPPHLFVPGRTLADVVQNALERGNLGDGATAQARARWLLEQDRTRPHQDQRLTRHGRVLEVRSDPTPGGGYVTTYTDVTENREAEDALRLAKSTAETANSAKSRFLASMSTELRTPLNAILAEAAALAREAANARSRAAQGFHPPDQPPGVAADAVLRGADAATDAARRLLAMIDAILDVARLEAGRFDLAEDTVDVQQLVRQCLRQSDSAAAAAEVALVVDLPDELPRIRCDERRLRQALGHLVVNAVRFTGAMGSVSLNARQEWTTGDLLLQVEDTGIGIPEPDLERVFEPFTKLEAGASDGQRRARGAGLGLYISRTLLRAHGGDLTLRSVPGQGTTATLRIPATRVLQDEARLPT